MAFGSLGTFMSCVTVCIPWTSPDTDHDCDLHHRFPIPSYAMAFRVGGAGGGNASSGMGVAEHSVNTFLELQRKKVHRYVIFKIDEKKKEVIVEKTGGPAESYDDFTASLPENDCRYAVFDFDFVTSENCQKSKIFFIAWSPSVARIRPKMLYATSKDRFRRELQGIHYEIQATDPTEMDLEVLRERAN
ncbi:hypothetical protein JHK87_057136 [Glycine soja]|nr:hypothetical protein JHK87_057136 [Glycine soja]